MTQERQDAKTVFSEALERESGKARADYLDEACGDDECLRLKVEGLLAAYTKAGDFLQTPPFASHATVEEIPLTEGPGTIIGRYKLLEKIGEGGMAVVYMAEQEQPIHRKVALKIIKLGMDTRQVIARFEAERQALALMDHPSIAKVLDAGATETGRPYFVMELVQGVSITEYCDRNSLSTKDRLALFIQVCNAVQHAHQKGIIHRDIKPSNVMVTHHDGKPVPKVIDFGIAKATNQRLTEKTLFTRYAHLIGTPAYMSPEQAELSDLDIDTRTDIYSLGVLLYELLTGTTPFSEEELRKAGYIEMQRVIREQEPARPSTKLSTLGDTLTDIAKHRGCTPDLLQRAVRGDLDWIVMKALEKDRSRRYETPNSLGSDILRHLEHEPVLARGPGVAYRVERFLRRHRVQMTAILAIVVVAVAVGVIVSMWNRDRAQLAEAEGFKHRGILSQAREQYAKANREPALETINPILNSRHVGPEARLLQATILVDNRRSDEAMAILNSLLNERPEVAGAAHSLLARILWESESPDAEKLAKIEDHRKRAEELLPETAEAYFLRAMTALTVKEQLASLDKALQLDPGHYESRRLRAYTYYASRKYDRLQDDALVLTVLHPRDLLGYSLRAVAWRELGHYKDAIADYDNALALTPLADPQHADLSVQRRETLLRMGEHERIVAEAKPEANAVPALQYPLFGALTALGEYDTATTLFRQIVNAGHEARRQFRDWCAKYVFNTLEAGRPWHPADREPEGAAFLPMVEAEETYHNLSAKGRRVTTDGFGASWSPDGGKLAFSLGVHGYSGVAVFDPTTKETDLLIVPGKDPKWSPDGKYIAFVRDCQFLRVAEFIAAERKTQERLLADEEVWIMKSEGTEPRRLARGGSPSWSQDSTAICYQSRVDNALCSISVQGQDATAKRIIACSSAYPSVSPDNQHVSFFDGGSLKIQDLASQEPIAESQMPSMSWGVTAWSPTGDEVCLGSSNSERDQLGLWLYDLHTKEFLKILDGQVTSAAWSPVATEVVCCLGPPYYDVWAAPLNPSIRTIEAFGPAQTLDEHLHEMLAFYTRRIEADPNDAYAYSGRAHYYDCLHDRARADIDMKQWSAVLRPGLPQDSSSETPRGSRHVIDLPLDYELVFSAERPMSTIPTMSVAFGQKGRCEMKLFEIPMFVASLLGFCVVSSFDTPPAHANFTFGAPTNVGSPLNSSAGDGTYSFSKDGLELYLASDRGRASGDYDLYVLTRVSVNEEWSDPVHMGSMINSSYYDSYPYTSPDGLELYFSSERPGGSGGVDLWMATRRTQEDMWELPLNLGPSVNSQWWDQCPIISSDGLTLMFISAYRPTGYGNDDIWLAKRSSIYDAWSSPVNLGPTVNTPYEDSLACLSPDDQILYFSSDRPGGFGEADLWMSRRLTTDDQWSVPVNLGPSINTSTNELAPTVSLDGSILYFASDRPGGLGGWDQWQAPIIPIVDFNADGKVDLSDLTLLIDNWGTDDTLYDIGPYAWGDGVVDIEDLKVFIAEWEKEISAAQQ